MIVIEVKSASGKMESVKLAEFKAAMIPALINGINKASFILQREIYQQLSLGGRVPGRTAIQRRSGARLPGGKRTGIGERWIRNPGVHLRIGTGALRSSWRAQLARQVSGGVEGRVVVSGAGQPYARIHEYGGFTGARLHISAKPVKNQQRGIRAAIHAFQTGTPSGGRAVYIKPRPYRGPALEAKRDEMVRAIIATVLAPLKGGK